MAEGIKMSQRDIERLEEGQREIVERLARIETKLENVAPVTLCERHKTYFSMMWWCLGTIVLGMGTLFIHAFTGGFTLN